MTAQRQGGGLRVGAFFGPFFASTDLGCVGWAIRLFLIIVAIALAIWLLAVSAMTLIIVGIFATLWLYTLKLYGKFRMRSIATDRQAQWAMSHPFRMVWVETPRKVIRFVIVAWRGEDAEPAWPAPTAPPAGKVTTF